MTEQQEQDSFADEPISSYEEWLNETASKLFGHPLLIAVKTALRILRHAQTRELLLINALRQKGVIDDHEVEAFFGDEAHVTLEKEALTTMTKRLVAAAARGEVVSPGGKKLDPDTVLVLTNDILDFNDTGWDGRTLEIMLEMAGNNDLQERYKKAVADIEHVNKSRADTRARREERARRVKILLAKCNIADKEPPSEDEQRQMIDGMIPIPNEV